MAYNKSMIFIETPIFTEDITKVLSDNEYTELQHFLALNPESGKLIQGSGGFRKLRWKIENRGKSGGIRIIYYLYKSEDLIYMIYVYKKSEKEDLTQHQIKLLRNMLGDN